MTHTVTATHPLKRYIKTLLSSLIMLILLVTIPLLVLIIWLSKMPTTFREAFEEAIRMWLDLRPRT